MLNGTGVKYEKFNSENQILWAVDLQASVGILVDASAGTTNSNGKKIVKAGTPLTGSLDARETGFTTASSTDVVGVLLHDVDVTTGDANGTLLLFGFVNTNRLDTDVNALLTAEVKTALPMIKFMAA